MRLILAGLIILLLLIQSVFWFGRHGVLDLRHLQNQVEVMGEENEKQREKNRKMTAVVKDLKHGYEVVEGRARSELGMIKQGEVFFQTIERQQ
jgi:cell division protein FtsB